MVMFQSAEGGVMCCVGMRRFKEHNVMSCLKPMHESLVGDNHADALVHGWLGWLLVATPVYEDCGRVSSSCTR